MVVYNNDNPEIWVRVHAQIGRYWLYQIGALAWIPLLANKCPGLWPNRKLLKHFKCLGGLPAVSPLSTSMPYSSFSSSFPSLLFICGQQREREIERERRGWGESPETATLNNISSAKVFLRLVPFFLCPHNEKERERAKKRGEGKTKRKLYGLNVNENEKFRQNSYEYEYPSSRAKPTSITQYQKHQQNKLKTSSLWGTWVIQSVLVTRDSLIYHHIQNTRVVW